MKAAIIFICGALTTFLVFILFQPFPGILFRSQPHAHHPKSIQTDPPVGSSLLIEYGEPIFIKDREENRFTLRIQGAAGSPLKYFWISTSGLATSGEGLLFENYGRISNEDFLNGLDSQNLIAIGDLQLGWSPNSSQHGWLYFDPNEATLHLSADKNERDPTPSEGNSGE
ncbi:hypothetical protein N9294_01800 [bacterium]|nr:hypothetical protein [Akkermansiaceae bacterium]MDB4422676.1 hypothetical protein [bacterium]